MDCVYYQKLMSRMLDGDLSDNETDNLRAHIQSCASCRSLFTAFSDVSMSLRENLAEPPAELKETVMSNLSAPRRKKSSIPLALKIMVPMAACFALMAAGAVYYTYYGGASAGAPSAESALQMAAAPKVSAADEPLFEAESAAGSATTEESSPADRSYALDASQMDIPQDGSAEAAASDAMAQPNPSDALAGSTEGSAMMAAAPASSELQADVYGEGGAYVGTLEGDSIDTFLNTVCSDGGSSYTAGEGASYTVDCGGTTYELIAEDGLLWWRIAGEASVTLSPSTPDDFLALIGS